MAKEYTPVALRRLVQARAQGHSARCGAIGRATEKILQLNREGVVNIRQLLCGVGQHPPNF